jgi:arsenate reductase
MTEITRTKDGKPVVTIYHNPRCSTSRTVLGLVREAGIEPKIIEYLKTPLTKTELARMVKAMGANVRDVVRKSESAYADRGLGAPGVPDDKLLAAMADEPILMNRPIVVTAKGVRLCRPADTVRELLP